MQNPLRRRNRALTAHQYDEVQKLVFDLVRERLVEAFGPNGMWTVGMKGDGENQGVFSETVAESLAWDVAAQLHSSSEAPAAVTVPTEAPKAPVDAAAAPSDADSSRVEQLVA